jgi:hypothetical protein
MTQRAGSLQTGGPVNGFFSAAHSQRGGFLIQSTSAVPNLLKFKNQGWYASGSTYETWVTVTAPNTFPPSGHTLTDISFVIFEDTA